MIAKLRKLHFASVFMILVLHCASAGATTVRIRVTDLGGTGLSKVLVITKSLEGERKEISRELTGSDGFAPSVDIAPGLYEAFATYPHGHLTSQAKDFVVAAEPATTELNLDYLWDEKISLDTIDWHVRVLDQEGHPVMNAWVTGRNAEASTGVSVARTDGNGRASVSVPVDGAYITVLYRGKSYSEPVYIETGLLDCQHSCFVRATAKLQKRPRTLTIKLP